MAGKQSGRINNDGKGSEEIFEKAMQKQGYAIFRLRDKRDLHGLNGRSVAAFGQPSDYIIVGRSGALLAEVKSSNEKVSFPFSCFTKAQMAAMSQCVACNVGHNYNIYAHNLNTDVWYNFTADDVVNIIRSGSKSMRWESMELSNVQ